MSDAVTTTNSGDAQPSRVEWVCSEHGTRYVSTIIAWHNGDPVGSPAFCDHCGAACAWKPAR